VYHHREPVTLHRACEATQIPSGEKVLLLEGSVVTVQQTLGGNFTVATEQGGLARIDQKDAEALGEPYLSEAKKAIAEKAEAAPASASGTFDEEQVWEALRTVYDPEIPANIVDLGLVYMVCCDRIEGGHRVQVAMTLTAPGCGIGPVLVEDVRSRVSSIPGVVEADVEVVFDPPWDPSRMSDAAKLQLGFM
jgi:probable FeS assembly SUF system protein SufT